MLDNLILLWLAAAPLMLTPGPATLSAAGVGAGYGLRRGAPYIFGVISGTASVLVLAASGVAAVLLAAPWAAIGLAALGAIYILYLAWKIATAPPLGARSEDAAAPAFRSGYVLAVANPKAYAALGALNASHQVTGAGGATEAGVKILALTLVIVVSMSLWSVFGAGLSRLLRRPVAGRAANLVFAALLLASVVAAARDMMLDMDF